MIVHFAGFLVVAFVVIATPGQDTVLTVRNALLGGRWGGAATALGVAAGQSVGVLATRLGLAALLRDSGPAFAAVRLLGAAYLVFLGIRSWRDALRAAAPERAHTGAPPPRTMRPAAAFRHGVISNLGNPKMAVFFGSLLPQFIAGHNAPFAAVLLLGLTFCALTLAWLTAYAMVVARAGDVLRRDRVRRTFAGVSGAVLIVLGLRLATERT